MKVFLPGIKVIIFGRYGSLLACLLLAMLLQPFLDTQIGKLVLEFFFIAVLFAGLRAIDIKKGLLGFEVVLLIVSLVLGTTGSLLDHEMLFLIGLAGRALFLVLVAFTILFDDKKKDHERLDAMLSLEGVGPVYASYFLDIATKGGYIIYANDLIDALRDAEKGSFPDDFYEVYSREELEHFMDVCRKFYKKHGFESYAELRGFLRNGYATDWSFEGF